MGERCEEAGTATRVFAEAVVGAVGVRRFDTHSLGYDDLPGVEADAIAANAVCAQSSAQTDGLDFDDRH